MKRILSIALIFATACLASGPHTRHHPSDQHVTTLSTLVIEDTTNACPTFLPFSSIGCATPNVVVAALNAPPEEVVSFEFHFASGSSSMDISGTASAGSNGEALFAVQPPDGFLFVSVTASAR